MINGGWLLDMKKFRLVKKGRSFRIMLRANLLTSECDKIVWSMFRRSGENEVVIAIGRTMRLNEGYTNLKKVITNMNIIQSKKQFINRIYR